MNTSFKSSAKVSEQTLNKSCLFTDLINTIRSIRLIRNTLSHRKLFFARKKWLFSLQKKELTLLAFMLRSKYVNYYHFSQPLYFPLNSKKNKYSLIEHSITCGIAIIECKEGSRKEERLR